MQYVPKSLEEQAYLIGREHGTARGKRSAAEKVRESFCIPLEFVGHANATAQYLSGQDDGFFCALDAAARRHAEKERADMLIDCADEMDRLESSLDRLEAGDAARPLPPSVGAVALIVSVGGTLLSFAAAGVLALCVGCAGAERVGSEEQNERARIQRVKDDDKAAKVLKKTFNGW